jgi:hypothetical protein
MLRWAIWLLTVVLAGCATKADSKSFQLTAQELGITYYYPQALLRVQRVSETRFTATFEIKESNVRPSQMDGITGLALMVKILVCPVWPFAEQVGSSAALTTKLVETGQTVHFEVLLVDADEADRIARSKPGSLEFWDFRDAAWESVRRDVCDNPDPFKPRSWPPKKS